jgi:hypothetical protein
MARALKSFLLVFLVAVAGVLGTASAGADPLPGFQFDPVKLEADMDACLAYQLPEDYVLMGWQNVRTAEQRRWRCSSLRHMYFDRDDRDEQNAHDPYVNVLDFMKCVDKVVSYGFPRPGTGGNITLNYQYDGTKQLATVGVNPATGDVVTIYTRTPDDWTGCANGL